MRLIKRRTERTEVSSEKSPFFKLSAEVRNMIYKMVIEDNGIVYPAKASRLESRKTRAAGMQPVSSNCPGTNIRMLTPVLGTQSHMQASKGRDARDVLLLQQIQLHADLHRQ